MNTQKIKIELDINQKTEIEFVTPQGNISINLEQHENWNWVQLFLEKTIRNNNSCDEIKVKDGVKSFAIYESMREATIQ